MELFSQAIAKAMGGSGAKTRAPDTFDGSDPSKLRDFLAQCRIYFKANPSKFSKKDNAKVMFAISYLKGSALAWVQNKMGDDDSDSEEEDDSSSDSDDEDNDSFSVWKNSWSKFVRIFSEHFGPVDAEGDAENSLDTLTMRDDKKILTYDLKFEEYSSRVQWDKKALVHRYYKGLAPRLKDEIMRSGRPSKLRKLQELARNIDSRYWQRQEEKRREHRDPAQAKPSSSSTPSKPSSSNPPKQQQRSATSGSAASGSSNAAASSSKSSSAPPAGRTKDGKLTEEERKRRMDNGLCLVCGGEGHMAKNCPKAKHRAQASGKAASAEAPATPKKD